MHNALQGGCTYQELLWRCAHYRMCMICRKCATLSKVRTIARIVGGAMYLVGGVHNRRCTDCGRCYRYVRKIMEEVHAESCGSCAHHSKNCGRCYGLWSFPAEINQRVSGRLAGLQSCNCLFFANIVNIIIVNIAGVITVIIIVALTIGVVVIADMNIITIVFIT